MENVLHHLVLVSLLATSGNCQDCSYPTSEDLEDVLKQILASPGETPVIDINSVHVVCLAFSNQKDRYRAVSVLVEYFCSGSSNCSMSGASEQIDSECDAGNWSTVSSVPGSMEDIRSQSPTADFFTAVREDCSFCLRPELAERVTLKADSITHCVG